MDPFQYSSYSASPPSSVPPHPLSHLSPSPGHSYPGPPQNGGPGGYPHPHPHPMSALSHSGAAMYPSFSPYHAHPHPQHPQHPQHLYPGPPPPHAHHPWPSAPQLHNQLAPHPQFQSTLAQFAASHPSHPSASPSSSSSSSSAASALPPSNSPSHPHPHPQPQSVSSSSSTSSNPSLVSGSASGGSSSLDSLLTKPIKPSFTRADGGGGGGGPSSSSASPSVPSSSVGDKRAARAALDDALSAVLERKKTDSKRQYLALKAKYEELDTAVGQQLRHDLDKLKHTEQQLSKQRSALLTALYRYEGKKMIKGEAVQSASGRWTRCTATRDSGEPCGNPVRIKKRATAAATQCPYHTPAP